jgi:P4 family phage/plasmid primase-like protien
VETTPAAPLLSDKEGTVAHKFDEPEDLRRMGYFTLPLPPQRKEPPPKGWVSRTEPYDIPAGGNVAIGVRGEVAILITNDDRSTVWATERFGEPNVRSVRGGHWYFKPRPEEGNEPDRETAVGTMEYYRNNKYALVPPSIHPTGIAYVWVRPLPPIDELPEAPDFRHLWHPRGEHHDEILRLSAAKAHSGLDAETITRDLILWRDSHLPDPHAHPDRELERIAKGSYDKFHAQAVAEKATPAPPPGPPDSGRLEERRPANPLEPLREAVAWIIRCLAHPNAHTADGMVPLLLVDLVVDEYGEGVRYDVDSGRFRVYNDGIWPENNTGIAIHLVEEILERIDRWCRGLLYAPATAKWTEDWEARVEKSRDEARKAGVKEKDLPTRHDVPAPPSPVPGIDDGAWKKAVLGAENLYAFRAERSKRREVDDAVHILATRPGIAIQSSDLNPDPWTLPVRTGLLDLRAGAVRPFSRSELWTWKSPYAPDSSKPATMWAAFMEQFAPDPDVRGYLRRLAYYFLTGGTGEQAVFDLWGPGKNGKTTFIETIAGLIPGAVVRADPVTFGDKASDRIPNDLARLRGARLVVVPEPARGLRLNEDLVHRFSGGDTISARFLHREFFDYVPRGKLLFYGSEKLRVVGQSTATWRRLRFIKAVHSFPAPGEPGNVKDYHRAMLAEEGDGILTWALAAREAFLADGLSTPEAIARDTADLREESDWLAAFLYDCVRPEANSTVAAKTMRSALVGWAVDNDEPAVARTSSRRLSTELEERGYKKSAHHGSAYTWVDVALTAYGLRCVEREERSARLVQRTIEEPELVPEGQSRGDRARAAWSKNHPEGG